MKKQHSLTTSNLHLDAIVKSICAAYVSLVMVISVTGVTFSRSTASAIGNDSAVTAKPVLSVERDYYVEEVGASDVGTCRFCVMNHDAETGRSEVAMSYVITPSTNFEYNGNVDYWLYRSDSTYTEITEIAEHDGDFSDPEMFFDVQGDETHYYLLEYTPDREGEFVVTLDVTATQSD